MKEVDPPFEQTGAVVHGSSRHLLGKETNSTTLSTKIGSKSLYYQRKKTNYIK